MGIKSMGKQIFDRMGKIVTILLAVFFVLTLVTVSAALAAPTETPQPAVGGKVVDVSIQNSAYNPASVQISTGDTVKWTNMDSTTHTVTGSTFESGNINKGQSYQFQFTEPGTYSYTCSIHPTMKGTVIVV
jgi:plastocyanin